VFRVYKPSLERWHSCLGHASIPFVERIVSSYNLPCSSKPNKDYVCDACQRAKNHQLPYSKSNSSSDYPLELIYSDVWGYALKFACGKQYYVSFIDDFRKFSLIYPLKFKFEVFQKFVEFQNLVECFFDRKIITMQMDWGGEYQKLHTFFSKVGFAPLAHASVPLKFWDDAFLAAVYLINRTPSRVLNFETPSRVLNFETPLECLFHQKPDYTSLHVFGSA
jgi:hypothetical protein